MEELYVKYKANGTYKSPMMTYQKMRSYFGCDDTELSRHMFALFHDKESGSIDVRKLFLAIASLVYTSAKDLLKFQFTIMDQENSGYLLAEDLVLMLQANHFTGSQSDVLHKAKMILSNSERVCTRARHLI